MNSPYNGKFKVTQTRHSTHDGLDLVGIDSKEIHATVTGVIKYAGWENPNDKTQGFGLYVCIESADKKYYYYGHLSEIRVKTGQIINICSTIGIEGSTGRSTGSHCHYCIRPTFSAGASLDVSAISGIPNAIGEYDDGYRPPTDNTHKIELYIDGQKKYSGLID